MNKDSWSKLFILLVLVPSSGSPYQILAKDSKGFVQELNLNVQEITDWSDFSQSCKILWSYVALIRYYSIKSDPISVAFQFWHLNLIPTGLIPKTRILIWIDFTQNNWFETSCGRPGHPTGPMCPKSIRTCSNWLEISRKRSLDEVLEV